MSRTARIAAAATLSALLCAGAATTASAVTNGSTKISAAGPGSINWDTAPTAGTNSINWD
ncbi:hypothetical protein ACFCZ1_16270 [Streptomyces sp. NPDC056224]|uniref:hypothetical protein n=1 Tax=Streptomyces sp. NPDC056224 TaxID=3345750 RepID=UPI0035E1A3BA